MKNVSSFNGRKVTETFWPTQHFEDYPLDRLLSLSRGNVVCYGFCMTDCKLGQCKNRTVELHQGWFLPEYFKHYPFHQNSPVAAYFPPWTPPQVISQRWANLNMPPFPLK